ncbi:MAG TPA: hypothetical protein VN931_09290 [Fibrobacteria bacterium]|nr:hypothetical protein [Fibrobacteria bacterium]
MKGCSATVLLLGMLLLSGCTDPFAPVSPETPTAGSTGQGSTIAQRVPVDFGTALDSGQSARIQALLTDSAQLVVGATILQRAQLVTCLDSLLSPSRSTPLTWTILGGSITTVSSNLSDSTVESFQYRLERGTTLLAQATATWTVVESGTEWRLQSWSETASSTGWVQLCASPR